MHINATPETLEHDVIAYKTVRYIGAYKTVRHTGPRVYTSEWHPRFRSAQYVSERDSWANDPNVNIVLHETHDAWHLETRGSLVCYDIGADMLDTEGVGYYLYAHLPCGHDMLPAGQAILKVRIPAGTTIRTGTTDGVPSIISPHIIVEDVVGVGEI